jgi:predicted helicase
LSCKPYKFFNKTVRTIALETYFKSKIKKVFEQELINNSIYRPFSKVYQYTDKIYNHRLTNNHYEIFSHNLKENNKLIIIPGLSSPKDFYNLASKYLVDLNCLPAGCQCLPLYRYDEKGNRIENITDWGLQQFHNHYCKGLARK